jgi:hypothetical protein
MNNIENNIYDKVFYIDLTPEELKVWDSTVYIWEEQDMETDYPIVVDDISKLTWCEDDVYYTHKSNIKYTSNEEIEKIKKSEEIDNYNSNVYDKSYYIDLTPEELMNHHDTVFIWETKFEEAIHEVKLGFGAGFYRINSNTIEVDSTSLYYVKYENLECKDDLLVSQEVSDTNVSKEEIFNKIDILLNDMERMIKVARVNTNESIYAQYHLADLLSIKNELKEIKNV